MAEASLIPKRAEAQSDDAFGFGIFFRIVLIFFIVSVLILIGLFLYRSILQGNLKKGQSALSALESQFPLETIERHEEVANAISASKKLLDGHLAQSKIFTFLEENTLPAIAYGSFSFVESDRKVLVSGE